MSDDEQDKTPTAVEDGIKEMKIKKGDSSDEEGLGTIRLAQIKGASGSNSSAASPRKTGDRVLRQSPVKSQNMAGSPSLAKDELEEIVGGEVTLKMEPGQPPKLARSVSQKVVTRSASLFDDYPDKTVEASSTFQIMHECSYSAKYLGSTEHAMECDCTEEWGKTEHIPSSRCFHTFVRCAKMEHRCYRKDQLCVWRRLGLYQSRYKNGVHW